MPKFTDWFAGLAAGTLTDAAKIAVTDTAGNYVSTNVETALTELADGTVLNGRYAPIDLDASSVGVGDVFDPTFSFANVSEALRASATKRQMDAMFGTVKTWDDFQGADDAGSLNGRFAPGSEQWTARSGTWGITSNRAYVSTLTGDGSTRAVATIPGVRDGAISTSFQTNLGSRLQGVVVRIDADNYIFVVGRTTFSTSARLAIGKVDAGVSTDLLAVTISLGAQTINRRSRMEVRFEGPTIRANWLGGSATYTLTGADLTKYDAVLTTVGITNVSATSINASSFFDNFMVTGV